MDNVPHLFDDRAWQQCLVSFLDDVSRQESHTRLVDYRTILRQFLLGRDPASISRDTVELFCSSDTVHGKPDYHTSNRRLKAIRSFYDFAISNGCFAGPNPAREPEKPKVPLLFNNQDWQACLTAWLEQLRSDETRSSYTNVIVHFFIDPDRCPDTYTRQEVERFIHAANASKQHNHGEPVKPSPATINARKAILSSFFEYSAGYQVVGPDKRLHALLQTPSPVKGIKQERVEPAHRLLSDRDLVALFAAIPLNTPAGIRDRAMFTAYLMLGRRNRELRLRWQDIEPHDFTTRDGVSYRGYRYRYLAKGKGQKWQYAELPLEIYEQITWYLIATGRENIQPDEGVFIPLAGSKQPLSSKSIRQILKAYCRAANVDPCVCVHSFRHANAQWRYRCGQGIMEICKALGHSHVGITHRYIAEVIEENDTGAPALAARLGPLLNR